MLAKSKLNSIEPLISQALNDIDISHKEFIAILNEKDKQERMKYNLISKNEDEKQEIIKLNYIIKKVNVIKKNLFIYLFIFFFLIYIKMLEITRKNCYKCNLETIIDNNSQYYWINLKIFEAGAESK